jgi:hypothetical protein
MIQNYNLSIQGGESRTRYAFSLGYFDQEGVIIESSTSVLHPVLTWTMIFPKSSGLVTA